ncbi:MAG: Na+/H+ antiporter NhaC family protein [Duodenibacillus sp.]|nr:Na+/H+ antiporter NhaC family protein [Duodenibacillus sp.]
MKKDRSLLYGGVLLAIAVVSVAAAAIFGGGDLTNTAWSLVPPFVAIALALITKEVYSSLFIGILVGAVYASGFSFEGTVNTVLSGGIISVLSDAYNVGILVFLVVLGAIVALMNKAGGSAAFGRWAAKNIKSRVLAQLATMFLGILIFIDDYFNCLTVGTVMGPITDLYKVSRAKLAYIIDNTAAPVCIIAPISSWAAAVGSSLKDTGAFDNEIGAFIATIPWNFYALAGLAMVVYLSWTSYDFGPMRVAERRAQEGDPKLLAEVKSGVKANPRGTTWDMIIPLAALIVLAVVSILWTGGYWGKDPKFHSVMAAIGNCSASMALVWASFGALLVALAMYLPRRLVSLTEFFEGCIEGMKLMLPANVILILAWTLSGVCRELLSTPQFMQQVVNSAGISGMLLPLLVFVLAAFLSFSMGTAWGTFGILIPIVVPVVQALDPALTVVVLSATLSGSVFGDHCSPISDTTILSSAGARCTHMEHVSTQLPYALLVAACAAIGYLVAGISGGNLWLSLGSSVLAVLGATTALHFIGNKGAAD